jgi:hypothetical protein
MLKNLQHKCWKISIELLVVMTVEFAGARSYPEG